MSLQFLEQSVSYNDGPIESAQFSSPYGIAVDSSGNIYVGDYGNQKIRKITIPGRSNGLHLNPSVIVSDANSNQIAQIPVKIRSNDTEGKSWEAILTIDNTTIPGLSEIEEDLTFTLKVFDPAGNQLTTIPVLKDESNQIVTAKIDTKAPKLILVSFTDKDPDLFKVGTTDTHMLLKDDTLKLSLTVDEILKSSVSTLFIDNDNRSNSFNLVSVGSDGLSMKQTTQ